MESLGQFGSKRASSDDGKASGPLRQRKNRFISEVSRFSQAFDRQFYRSCSCCDCGLYEVKSFVSHNDRIRSGELSFPQKYVDSQTLKTLDRIVVADSRP
jgi:hypothetical protein